MLILVIQYLKGYLKHLLTITNIMNKSCLQSAHKSHTYNNFLKTQTPNTLFKRILISRNLQNTTNQTVHTKLTLPKIK